MVKAGGSGVVDSATILFCFAQLPRTASQPEPQVELRRRRRCHVVVVAVAMAHDQTVHFRVNDDALGLIIITTS